MRHQINIPYKSLILGVLTIVILIFGVLNSSYASVSSAGFEKIKLIKISIDQNLHPESVNRIRSIYQKVFKRLGYEVELVFLPAIRSIVHANNGITDGLAFQCSRLAQGDKYPNLIRINEIVGRITLQAYTLDPNIRINGYKSLKDKAYSVAHIRGMLIHEYSLPLYLKKQNIYQLNTAYQGFKMLLSDRIDIFAASNSLDVLKELKRNEFKNKGILLAGVFKTIYIYPYIHIKHKNLVNDFTNVLNDLKRQNHFRFFKLV